MEISQSNKPLRKKRWVKWTAECLRRKEEKDAKWTDDKDVSGRI